MYCVSGSFFHGWRESPLYDGWECKILMAIVIYLGWYCSGRHFSFDHFIVDWSHPPFLFSSSSFDVEAIGRHKTWEKTAKSEWGFETGSLLSNLIVSGRGGGVLLPFLSILKSDSYWLPSLHRSCVWELQREEVPWLSIWRSFYWWSIFVRCFHFWILTEVQ